MDLEGRVTALEDEVSILKAEIKSVLVELRPSFLAQNNPFTNPSLNLAALPSAQAQQAAASNGKEPIAPVLPEPRPEAPIHHVEEHFMPTASATAEPSAQPVPKPAAAARPEPVTRAVEPVVTETTVIQAADAVPAPPRFDMNTLAMLMAWTQGNMARLNLSEMGSLLALARYGGVIERELEEILLKIADHFESETDARTGQPRLKPTATISEYLLALHELHTVINEEDEPAFRWLRKIA